MAKLCFVNVCLFGCFHPTDVKHSNVRSLDKEVLSSLKSPYFSGFVSGNMKIQNELRKN